jgi:hypothetical protein
LTATNDDGDSLKKLIATKPPPPEPPTRKHFRKSRRRRNHNQPVILNKCLQCAKNYVLPILVTVLASLAWIVGSILLIPTAYPTSDILFYFNQIWTAIEVMMTLISYFQCLRTNPGHVQPDWETTKCHSVEDRNALMDLEPQKNGEARYCHKCGVYQPPRSHHSSVHNK